MKLYLASGNPHKVQEFQALAETSRLDLQFVSAREAGGMPPVVEDTGTFLGNARKKAAALKAILPESSWVLADDSGLCVDALGGAPGVESAYYAGSIGDPAANLRKLVETLRDVADNERGAHFICLLLLLGPENRKHVFEGRCEGTLLRAPRGGSGFGYDPLIVPAGEVRTLAEMTDQEKNAISHRGRAAVKLFAWCRQFLDTPKSS